jgi:hypothetical protein
MSSYRWSSKTEIPLLTQTLSFFKAIEELLERFLKSPTAKVLGRLLLKSLRITTRIESNRLLMTDTSSLEVLCQSLEMELLNMIADSWSYTCGLCLKVSET